MAIGRALVRDVDVFLFDEPLSNLDAKLRADLRVEIKRLHQSLQNTMIYVTHDQVEAMTLADRIAIMKGGVIMQLSSPDEIYNCPINKYVADFIGSPSMNFLKGSLRRDPEAKVKLGQLDFSLNTYGFTREGFEGDVWFGIRPEHVQFANAARNAPVSFEVKAELVEPMGGLT